MWKKVLSWVGFIPLALVCSVLLFFLVHAPINWVAERFLGDNDFVEIVSGGIASFVAGLSVVYFGRIVGKKDARVAHIVLYVIVIMLTIFSAAYWWSYRFYNVAYATNKTIPSVLCLVGATISLFYMLRKRESECRKRIEPNIRVYESNGVRYYEDLNGCPSVSQAKKMTADAVKALEKSNLIYVIDDMNRERFNREDYSPKEQELIDDYISAKRAYFKALEKIQKEVDNKKN